ncbi:unnamed protein product [Cunninghamella blakesleeana]
MSYNNYSFMSTLDSLVLETTEQPMINNDEAAAEELALWTNAKFKYDIAPGQGILDDKALDKKIYDQLANYLNMDLISQPTTTSSSPSISTISSPSTINIDDSPMINTSDSFKPILSKPPTLLPKPPQDINQLAIFPTSLPILPTLTTPHQPIITAPSSSIVNNNPIQKKKSSTSSIKNTSSSNHDHSMATDDDKRRRNTAASARFRIKKKLKEQALAENVREMTDKAEKLQNRVHELENEIKWLRDLLLEKNGSK